MRINMLFYVFYKRNANLQQWKVKKNKIKAQDEFNASSGAFRIGVLFRFHTEVYALSAPFSFFFLCGELSTPKPQCTNS